MKQSHRHCPNCGRPREWDYTGKVIYTNQGRLYTCVICKKAQCWDCGGIPKTIGREDSFIMTSTVFVRNPDGGEVCQDCVTQVLTAHMARTKEEKP